jgi:hypothetical protein
MYHFLSVTVFTSQNHYAIISFREIFNSFSFLEKGSIGVFEINRILEKTILIQFILLNGLNFDT